MIAKKKANKVKIKIFQPAKNVYVQKRRHAKVTPTSFLHVVLVLNFLRKLIATF